MREQFEKLPEIEKIIKNGIHYNDRFNCYQSIDGISYLTIARINGAWYAFQEQQTKINAVLQYLDTGDHPLDFSANTIRELLK